MALELDKHQEFANVKTLNSAYKFNQKLRKKPERSKYMKYLVAPFLILILAVSCSTTGGIYTVGSENDAAPNGLAQLKMDYNPAFEFQKIDIMNYDGKEVNIAVADKPEKMIPNFMPASTWSFHGRSFIPKAAVSFPAGEHEFRFKWEAVYITPNAVHNCNSAMDDSARFEALPGKTYVVQTRVENLDKNSWRSKFSLV